MSVGFDPGRMTWRGMLVGFLVCTLGSCDDDGRVAAPSPTGDLAVVSRLPDRPGGTGKVALRQGRLRISGEGMTAIDTLVPAQDGRLRVEVSGVPVGLRLVQLDLQDGDGTSLWSGNTQVDVVADSVTLAVLLMERVGDAGPEILDVTVTPALGLVGDEYTFSARVEDRHDRTDSLAVRWDFDGDGVFDTDWMVTKSTSHVYTAAGTMAARVESRDRSGLVTSTTAEIEVFFLTARIGTTARPDTVTAQLTEGRVVLDGSASSGREGSPLVYHWRQLLGIEGGHIASVVGTLSDNDSSSAARTTFDPTLGRGLYVFTLSVEDEETGLRSPPDTTYVILHSRAPVVTVLTAEPRVTAGDTLRLLAEGADADGDSLRFRWRGEAAGSLSDTTGAAPLFLDKGVGEHDLRVVAIDADPQESEPVEVTVTVEAALSLVDSQLESAVRAALGLAESTPSIRASGSLAWLAAEGAGIRSLNGIEHLTSLRSLNLADNAIVDLSPLASLTGLDTLQLAGNRIADLSPLRDLTALRVLDLEGNQVTDLTALAFLTGLRRLNLADNEIQELGALVDNDGLAAGAQVYLQGNPLDESTRSQDLPELLERGVLVDVAALVDVEPPRLESSEPAAGATDVAPTAIIRMVFSEALDPNVFTQDASAVTVSDGTRTVPPSDPPSFDEASRSLELRLAESLAFDTHYTIELSAAITDLAGNPLMPVVWGFTTAADTRLAFVDANLEAAVLEAVGKAEAPLLSEDVAGLSTLNAAEWGIQDLSGIEALSDMGALDLHGNRISDLSPLAGLTGLWDLQLYGNAIVDVSPLAALTGLLNLDLCFNAVTDLSPLESLSSAVFVGLCGNDITDISPLAGMVQLREARLDGNRIADITALSGLTRLETVHLNDNAIEDLAPLLDNSGLGDGDAVFLGGNPLSATALSEDVPALIDRGVTLDLAIDTTDVGTPASPMDTTGTSLVFEDTFDDNGSGWREGIGDDGSLRIDGGVYEISVNQGWGIATFVDARLDTTWDYRIEASFTFVDGDLASSFGLLFGVRDGDAFFAYRVSRQGFIQLSELGLQNGEYVLSDHDFGSVEDPGVRFTLAVERRGDTLTLWIDDSQVASLPTPELPGSKVGFDASGPVTFSVDRLTVEHLSP